PSSTQKSNRFPTPATPHQPRGGEQLPFTKGSMVRLPYGAGTITLRPITSTPLFLAIGITVPGSEYYKTHY
ncbi:hypothetical protein, partial [Lichenibacterium minor]|uniref:hypothetical protein n=1 Tax=Lichenibacterium minor TaxID=2316528 RepID=UPI001A922B5F